MASFVVRNIEDSVRDRLRELAARHGRSMEEEIREILRAAVVASFPGGDTPGLGSATASLFEGTGFDAPVEELRGQAPRTADLG